ncbi:MAG: TrpR-like protein YerC/YecD [Ruminococcus sp.]|jgi:TrpR-related protein YerC/YecD|nr:TrpR-like protein YerC/YecD [Ruminococcus sp.]
MQPNVNNDQIRFLYKAILTLKTEDECQAFFEDVTTVLEVKSIAQRLTVAKMLHDKTVYHDIVESTGASTATISRVNRSLQYGKGAYNLVFDRLGE